VAPPVLDGRVALVGFDTLDEAEQLVDDWRQWVARKSR
jgi:hypothetical protein